MHPFSPSDRKLCPALESAPDCHLYMFFRERRCARPSGPLAEKLGPIAEGLPSTLAACCRDSHAQAFLEDLSLAGVSGSEVVHALFFELAERYLAAHRFAHFAVAAVFLLPVVMVWLTSDNLRGVPSPQAALVGAGALIGWLLSQRLVLEEAIVSARSEAEELVGYWRSALSRGTSWRWFVQRELLRVGQLVAKVALWCFYLAVAAVPNFDGPDGAPVAVNLAFLFGALGAGYIYFAWFVMALSLLSYHASAIAAAALFVLLGLACHRRRQMFFLPPLQGPSESAASFSDFMNRRIQ